MEIRVDDGMVDVVEHDIRPPMRQSITIPLTGDIAIYVSTSPFVSISDTTDDQLVKLARRIASALRGEFHDPPHNTEHPDVQ